MQMLRNIVVFLIICSPAHLVFVSIKAICRIDYTWH